MNTLQSYDARTGATLGAPLPSSTTEDIDACVAAAARAFDHWRSSTAAMRAGLLRALATALEAQRESLVPLADSETALGTVRLNGELDRTCFQLRRFAQLAEDGVPFARLQDPAVAGPPPAGHPAMVLQRVPLGPVAVFAASNFPFAFSVLGGDTASALAAGCSVVVKAHPGHPRLSLAMHAAAQDALRDLGLPEGLIGMVQGAEIEVGVHLVRHPAIAAAGFTGSTRGGAALQAHAQQRPRPIPFYGELGSVNPVVVLPPAIADGGAALAQALASSIALGCGQFCTSPGVLLVLECAHSEGFVAHLREALAAQQPHPMLSVAMRRAYEHGVATLLESGATPVLHEAGGPNAAPRPFLGQVEAAQFIADARLREEVFGPASLVVRAAALPQIVEALDAVGGSLTVTLLGAGEESEDNRRLVGAATAIAGRVLFAGVPTGVAVTAAQHHGGPWPASTAPMTTSVGDRALDRFLRPVCLQEAPAWVLQAQPY